MSREVDEWSAMLVRSISKYESESKINPNLAQKFRSWVGELRMVFAAKHEPKWKSDKVFLASLKNLEDKRKEVWELIEALKVSNGMIMEQMAKAESIQLNMQQNPFTWEQKHLELHNLMSKILEELTK